MKNLRQTTDTILMVRPHKFIFNPQTSSSNAFQQQGADARNKEFERQALQEFDGLAEILRANGIEVIVKQDTPMPPKPDAIFPNNWVMFHHSGKVSLFPMEAENRRNERRMDIIEDLKENFKVDVIENWAEGEANGRFLEGTGSMVFDHINRIAYACLSTRTDAGLFRAFCQEEDYEPHSFSAFDAQGRRIYHTNVIMCVGKKLVVLCLESVSDKAEQEQLQSRIESTGHTLVDISLKQMNQFAGNMLQLTNNNGEDLLVMSSRAFGALSSHQVETIEKHCKIVHSPLTTIENIGGGSARCMMAEVFLPKK